MNAWADYNERLRRTRKDRPSWRYGQACFNVLNDYDFRLADEIRGTELDPFYDDSRVPAFLAWLAGNLLILPAERETLNP